eukprot:TRINITY_DN5381_c0_g1_i3.p1 TRINITY_DN5381_c0_g1~~TRINITY_DN5381_c0_g1_i3.p1  ORF type:complete len:181 (-),score=18.85 TRINITY_DN5381_c0_g1_i3:158-700(-)
MISSFNCARSTAGHATNQVKIRCQAEIVKNVKFRRGKQEDMEQIYSMVRREKLNPYTLKPDRFVVAERDGSNELAGCVSLEDLGNNNKQMRTLIVQPEYRGNGLGKILVSEIMKDANGSIVYLITFEFVSQFYEKCGFIKIDPFQLPQQLWVLRNEFVRANILKQFNLIQPIVVMKKDLQ